jgi:hypothetical protein
VETAFLSCIPNLGDDWRVSKMCQLQGVYSKSTAQNCNFLLADKQDNKPYALNVFLEN